ncbi:MAG: helix-turn-helix domain-containing protein [Lachnospiraceae bacterium]
MAVSYKKLWKILIDRDMKKKDLCVAAGISHASMAKLGKKRERHNRCTRKNLYGIAV